MPTKEEEILELWKNYSEAPNLQIKNKLIINYLWLIKYVLQNMNLPKNTLLSEADYIHFGILGLSEAIERFELERGIKFESYALPRVKGTIQDELRKLDWLSRTARKKAQDFTNAADFLRGKEGREVTIEEIRKKLNVSEEVYLSYLEAAAAAKNTSYLADSNIVQTADGEYDIIEELADPHPENVVENIENEERINFISHSLSELKESKRNVMILYYYENLTFKEIGQLLNISESRVCQIHTQVLKDLKQKVAEFENA
ncbi:MAG: sigma-70 family RNA polymerase sigma factor [Ignavibacteria bacterium]|jgi:RNA polymerase sigma factor for flagellar operon FliA|nr:sigma-70 family RNA polymerase sigma factor [Ignavibacteria bacterium]